MHRAKARCERAMGRATLVAGACAGAMLLASASASAHIHLEQPASWLVEDGAGNPQKAGPCGVQAGETYTETNTVTTYAPGETITVKWSETVPHTGWFRIALSTKDDLSDLVDPEYTHDNSIAQNSLDASIESPVKAPVLVDGLFQHKDSEITAPKEWSTTVTLPKAPCKTCTLQVIQVMLNHFKQEGGYTYHHCAKISIADGVTDGGMVTPGDASTHAPEDGGTSSGDDDGMGDMPMGDSGATKKDASTSGSRKDSGTSRGNDAGDDDGESADDASGEGGSPSSGGCSVARGTGSTRVVGMLGLVGLAGVSLRRRRR